MILNEERKSVTLILSFLKNRGNKIVMTVCDIRVVNAAPIAPYFGINMKLSEILMRAPIIT